MIDWLADRDDVSITAVTVGEIWVGIENLPDGRRKTGLARIAGELFESFSGDIYPYDESAAARYGRIVASRKKAGRPIGYGDAQIAAICAANGCWIATRNVKDFMDIGLEVVNPWGM